MKFEEVLLRNLVKMPDYASRVMPFLKAEYFLYKPERVVYELIDTYVNKYQKLPSIEALEIDSQHLSLIAEEKKVVDSIIADMKLETESKDLPWLLDTTEKFCQDKAIYNGIMSSIQILDGKDKTHTVDNIPKLLQDALGVSFDTDIGHDFIKDAEKRFDFYNKVEEKIPFDLNYFNIITRGGFLRKTLNILLAGTAVGKSLFMCHMAASNMMDGQNVLYITLELSEEKVAERIDANLLDVPIEELEKLPRNDYLKKMERLKDKVKGRLIIKEYPTATASSANFRHLLNELKTKSVFVPDVIYIDYLNLALSARIRYGANVNSYTYVKSIAEELRGLAVEFNVAIVSATQTTRTGFSNSDPGLEDTSESFGLPATADFMVALISTDELASLNQVLVKQLKNRYSDPGKCKRFVVGIDKSRMRLYNLDDSAQKDLVDDAPVMTPSFSKSHKPSADFLDFT